MPASPAPFSGDPDWQARLSGQTAPVRPAPLLPARTEWQPPAAVPPLTSPPAVGASLNAPTAPLPSPGDWPIAPAAPVPSQPPIRASIPGGRQTFPPGPPASTPLFALPQDWQSGSPSAPPAVPPRPAHPVAFVEPPAWQAPGQPATPWSPPAQGWPAPAPAPPSGAPLQPPAATPPRAEIKQPALPRPSRVKPEKRRSTLLRWVLIVLIAVLVVLAAYLYVTHSK